MFNKEGIPFFLIIIPFLSVLFISFFITSYYLKVSDENFLKEITHYKQVMADSPNLAFDIETKNQAHMEEQESFKRFVLIITGCILIFMAIFTIVMTNIINDVVKKYIAQVQSKEQKLQDLNATLEAKVKKGIQAGKRKDKAILEQSKLARMGSMISMIAHQWRQPLSELSGVLMELETATRFKKVDDKHILDSIERSDKMIEFMSNTIDDFRNFYKPDKTKENFFVLDSCKKALNLIDATLKNLDIQCILNVREDRQIHGYPTEYSQVVLNILSNAKDILVERDIANPRIEVNVDVQERCSVVTIQDNAGGINEEHFELLFDPYFSTKDASKGTGLGLYISKLIIEKNMDGELDVYNDSQGAVFKIVLRNENG